MGYVGFSVAFAFAIAALLGGTLDATWARWSRPWTTVAWSFLTIGIALGSWWAYYELGWGGWWFWDPVENASFMPWLVGTALAAFARRHREARHVQELDGAARDRRVLAVAARHVPRALGRAHVGARVRHRSRRAACSSWRSSSIVVGGSLTLYALRAGAVGGGAGFAPVSRESLLLANNVLLIVAMRERAARHAVSAVPRRAEPRQDLGRPALLRRGVLPADGAGRVPDGHRPHRELAQGRAAGPVDAAQVGVRRRDRHRAAAAVRARALVAADRRSASSSRCGSSRRRSRWSCSACGHRRSAGSAPSSPPIPPRGTACSSRISASRCSSSASRWSRATTSSRT